MKISDEDLIEAVWLKQISNTAKGVLHNYVGGTKGLCQVDGNWQVYATDVHVSERHLITNKIAKQQIYKRVRDLISRGFLYWSMEDTCFALDNKERTLNLFLAARSAWVSLGVPELSKGNMSASIKIENYESKLEQVKEMLIAEHSPYFPQE